jgi:hypothetical protein
LEVLRKHAVGEGLRSIAGYGSRAQWGKSERPGWTRTRHWSPLVASRVVAQGRDRFAESCLQYLLGRESRSTGPKFDR